MIWRRLTPWAERREDNEATVMALESGRWCVNFRGRGLYDAAGKPCRFDTAEQAKAAADEKLGALQSAWV